MVTSVRKEFQSLSEDIDSNSHLPRLDPKNDFV